MLDKLKLTLFRRSIFFRFQSCLYVKGRSGFIIPLTNGIGEANEASTEPSTERIISFLINNTNGCFIDVGVNIGQTLISVKSADRARNYIGFEVQPECLSYTRKLISANDFENTHLVGLGLFSENAILKLHSSGNHDAGATLTPQLRARNYTSTLHCIVDKGDHILSAIGVGDIGVIKIDTEGSELQVLRGLVGTLKEKRPFVLCEVLPCEFSKDVPEKSLINNEIKNARRESYSGIRTLLHDTDYVSLQITSDGLVQSDDFAHQIDDIGDVNNYVFCPKEKLNEITAIRSLS